MTNITKMTEAEIRQQVYDQCRVVAHLADAISNMYGNLGYAVKDRELPIAFIGPRTAAFMDQLGDMLNATDAADDEDAWCDPIFERAHELFGDPSDSPPRA